MSLSQFPNKILNLSFFKILFGNYFISVNANTLSNSSLCLIFTQKSLGHLLFRAIRVLVVLLLLVLSALLLVLWGLLL